MKHFSHHAARRASGEVHHASSGHSSRRAFRVAALGLLLLVALSVFVPHAAAQTASRPEYRAYWVETFNTPLGTRAEIDRVVDAAVRSNANALFAQVRRRGDSWYLNSLEPFTQVAGVGEPDANGVPTIDPSTLR